MRIRNFLFHRVCDEQDNLWPPMPPKLFEEVIRYLKKNFQIVALEEFILNQQQFKNSKNLATISFDDGYKDNLEYAAPILKKHHCPASFYVVTDCIDRNLPTWTYIVDYVFQHIDAESIQIDFDYVPENLKSINVKSGTNAQVKKLKPWMKSLSNKQRISVLQTIIDQGASTTQVPQHLMMNWGDVKQLHKAGFLVSSHTHTHPMLAKLETEEELRGELLTSYNKIAENLQFKPQAISYPMGSFNKKVEEMANECGYTFGLAVEQKFYDTKKENVMAIPRVEIYYEPKWKIYGRINGMYNNIKRLLQ